MTIAASEKSELHVSTVYLNEAGYIVYNGTMSFDEIMKQHEEQTFAMEDFV